MKLRTSSSDTLLRKDITRFMPFWCIYILCLLLGLLLTTQERDSFYQVMNLAVSARAMALVNCGYALLVAELLFGDLYDSRMCSGIHSLPLRRETIFGVHILSGVLFSLVPTLLMALVSLPVMARAAVENAWQISLLWLLSANLQFLFFFGLAVFCVFLTGNRFAMAVVYGIANIWALLLELVVNIIYLPLLPGVSVRTDGFELLSPIYHMTEQHLFYVERELKTVMGTFRLEPGWGYLWACAGLGILLMGLALLLYRKRKLETCGDFIALPWMKPVFLVIFSLMTACCCVLGVGLVFGFEDQLTIIMILGLAGLIIGWFVGAMLMEKTMRVFTKKTLLGGGILTAVMLLTILITWMDPAGVHTWLPDEQEVAYVRVTSSYNFYGSEYRRRYSGFDMEEKEIPADAILDLGDIHSAVRLHTLALEQKLTQREVDLFYEQYYSAVDAGQEKPNPERKPLPISLEYTMDSGRVIRRYYYIWNDGETGQLASWLFSQPQVVFGEMTPLEKVRQADSMSVYGVAVPDEYLDRENMDQLKQAIARDCEEGHMAQVWELHRRNVFSHPDYPQEALYMDISIRNGDICDQVYLQVFGDATHTLRWFADRGILDTVRQKWSREILEYQEAEG